MPSNTASVHAFGVVVGLNKVWRDGGHEDRLGHAFRSVFADVAGHFAAAHGKADQGEIAKVELGDQLVQIFGKSVVVVAGGWLARLAESATIVGDDAMALGQEHRELFFPG